MGWYLPAPRYLNFSTLMTSCEEMGKDGIFYFVGIFYQCLFCFLLFPWLFLALEGRLSEAEAAATTGAAERVWIVDSMIFFSPILTNKAFLLLAVASFSSCLSSYICACQSFDLFGLGACPQKLTSNVVGYLDSLFFKMFSRICLTSWVSLGLGSFCFSSIFSNSLDVEHKTWTCLC